MIEFYLLAFSRFPLRQKNTDSGFHERIELSTPAILMVGVSDYLLDHSGDEVYCLHCEYVESSQNAQTTTEYILYASKVFRNKLSLQVHSTKV